MAALTAAFLKARFDEIVGWPYVSPGSNDERGIDCSGAFVRAYQKSERSIAHGSNAIERQYCRDCYDLEGSTARLEVGMAIFKYKEPAEAGYNLPDKYKTGGKSYNGDLRDYSHIGLVTGVNPLRITHATSPTAKVDTKLGTGIHSWRRAGWLKAAQYGGAANGTTRATNAANGTNRKEGGIMSELEGKTCIVKAESGDTVNLRKSASTGGALVARVPIGNTVLCETNDGEWANVRWDDVRTGRIYKGYMMTQFLAEYDGEGLDDAEMSGSGGTAIVDAAASLAGADVSVGGAEAYRVCVDFSTREAALAFRKALVGCRVERV